MGISDLLGKQKGIAQHIYATLIDADSTFAQKNPELFPDMKIVDNKKPLFLVSSSKETIEQYLTQQEASFSEIEDLSYNFYVMPIVYSYTHKKISGNGTTAIKVPKYPKSQTW